MANRLILGDSLMVCSSLARREDLAGQAGGAAGGVGAGGVGVSPASLEAAGGIGGLLAMRGTEDWDYYIYLHDANGNVGQLVWWQDDTYEVPPLGPGWSPAVRFAATYEYDPYGNAVTKYGWFADDNPFRFSTKYYDAETALYYFGQRYYRPWLGRFINRDPIEERGGVNLYAYVGNEPTDRVDAVGEAGGPGGGLGTLFCPAPGRPIRRRPTSAPSGASTQPTPPTSGPPASDGCTRKWMPGSHVKNVCVCKETYEDCGWAALRFELLLKMSHSVCSSTDPCVGPFLHCLPVFYSDTTPMWEETEDYESPKCPWGKQCCTNLDKATIVSCKCVSEGHGPTQ